MNPISERFGVCDSHFILHDVTTMEKEYQVMAEAGIKNFRIAFAWPDLEPKKGEWDWLKADIAVEKAQKYGVKLLIILGGTPIWAAGGGLGSVAPANMSEWKNYVLRVVSRYRTETISAYEIWNEQNTHAFWSPPDAAKFTTYVQAAKESIRTANSVVKIINGGVAGADLAFNDNMLKAGVYNYIDALAYHPYPETLQWGNYTALEENSRLIGTCYRNAIKTYTNRPLEVWITEVGWSTPIVNGVYVRNTPESQAYYFTRSLLNHLDIWEDKTNKIQVWIDKYFYYNLWPEELDLSHMEQCFGLLNFDFTPKPAFVYVKNLLKWFGSAYPTNSESVKCTYSGKTCVIEKHCFLDANGDLLVALWNRDDSNQSTTVSLPTTTNHSNKGVKQYNFNTGESVVLSALNNVALSKIPIALKFQKK